MGIDSVARVLERFVPLVAGARRIVGVLAVTGACAGALIGWALFADGLPDERGATIARFFVLALALIPAVVLSMLWLALGEVMEIPARVRRLPETARGHASDLERVLRELDASGGRRRRVSAVWRLAKLPVTARESLLIYAPLTALLSVPFLVASALSALVVPVELLVALIAVLLAA